MPLTVELKKAFEALGIKTELSPWFNTAPNRNHFKSWANSQLTRPVCDLASTLVSNVQHISQQEFLQQLKQTVDDFNLRSADRPYVLLIAEHREEKREIGCSDCWVPQLALSISI